MAGDKKTDHPHIVKTEGVLGGRARIRGHRISVELIADFFRRGETPEDIFAMYPQLKLAAVHDAIGYYLDHLDEIKAELEARDEAARDPDAYMAKHGWTRDEKGFYRFGGAQGERVAPCMITSA